MDAFTCGAPSRAGGHASLDHLTHVASGLRVQGIQKDPQGAVTGVTVKQVPGRKANDTFLKLTWLADVRPPRLHRPRAPRPPPAPDLPHAFMLENFA